MGAASKITAAVITAAASVALTSPAFAAGADAGLGTHGDLVHGIQLSGSAAAGIASVAIAAKLVNRYRRSVWRRNWVLRQGTPVVDRSTGPSWSTPLVPGQRPMSTSFHRSSTHL